ncbi:hypothetical protein BHM03_00030091 [Ensete ventricosum]|nr:hypothetical protein BHM03_00030091 [Ensete ventricosum]
MTNLDLDQEYCVVLARAHRGFFSHAHRRFFSCVRKRNVSPRGEKDRGDVVPREDTEHLPARGRATCARYFTPSSSSPSSSFSLNRSPTIDFDGTTQ